MPIANTLHIADAILLLLVLLVLFVMLLLFIALVGFVCFFAYRHIKELKQGPGADARGGAGCVAGYPVHRSFLHRLLWRIRHAWRNWSDRVPREGHVRFQNDEASIAGFGFQADPSGDASLPVFAFSSCVHTNTNTNTSSVH